VLLALAPIITTLTYQLSILAIRIKSFQQASARWLVMAARLQLIPMTTHEWVTTRSGWTRGPIVSIRQLFCDFSTPWVVSPSLRLTVGPADYVLGEPEQNPCGTVFLVHGISRPLVRMAAPNFSSLIPWPAHSCNRLHGLWWHRSSTHAFETKCCCHWLRVLSFKEAPRIPPETIELYGFKRCADDIAELVKQMGLSSIVLGGHDW